MTDTIQILRQVFSGLEGPDLDALRQVVARRRIPAGTIICHEGATEHEFYIITQGKVSISKRFVDGQERILSIRGAGEFFGEMALVEHKPRAATVVALVETELLVVTEVIFEQILTRNPIMALALLRQVSSRLRQTDRLTIVDLEKKNEELRRAYQELQLAQAELVEKQRMERELEIAAEVQRSILPTCFPELTDFSFAARTRPARLVGGDFYDMRLIGEDKLAVLTADVSGKSVHAAIFMAITRGLFLAEARHSASPREVIVRVHNRLIELTGVQSMFVTAFYAIIDTQSGQLRYARAGHERPLHYRQGQVSRLPGDGRFLGMFDGFSADERELQLLPGDLLVLFSDGVTDAMNTAGEQFGIERLSHIVRKRAPLGAQAVCDAVFDGVLAFQETAAQFDDITLQVIAYQENNFRGR